MTTVPRRPLDITKVVTHGLVKIYFNGVPHLVFVRRDAVGFQAWKWPAFWAIELTFRNGAVIVTDYDDAEKWKRVIELIEDELTP